METWTPLLVFASQAGWERYRGSDGRQERVTRDSGRGESRRGKKEGKEGEGRRARKWV